MTINATEAKTALGFVSNFFRESAESVSKLGWEAAVAKADRGFFYDGNAAVRRLGEVQSLLGSMMVANPSQAARSVIGSAMERLVRDGINATEATGIAQSHFFGGITTNPFGANVAESYVNVARTIADTADEVSRVISRYS